MNWRRVKALIVKEFFQIIRDPSSIMIAVVLPLILLFVYGFGVSLDADNIRIALVLQENGPEVADFTSSLRYSHFLKVEEVLTMERATKKLQAGDVAGIVVIPENFTRLKSSLKEVAPIQVIADGSVPNTASFVQNYVKAAWINWLHQQSVRGESDQLPLVSLVPRFWYNEELDSRNFLIPGTIAIIMTLIGTLLTALVLSREWERGTMEALMATPVTISEILVGKLIPYYCLGIGSMVMCTLIAVFIYNVPLRGNLGSLFAATSAFLCAALGIGLFISATAKNQFVASQMAVASAFLPAFILSGFIFEITSMPAIIQFITNFVPARYFVSSLKTIFLAGTVWEVLLPNLLKMILFAGFLFLLIKRKTVKRLD